MLRPFILSLVITSAGWAGDLALTVESAGEFALKHNPTLAAARLRIEEAKGRLEQSGRLANPELEVDLARNTTGREGSLGVAFMQRFPLTARLRHEKAVSRAELAAAQAEVRDGERKLIAEVRVAAVKILALRGQRELRNQRLKNSRELSSFLVKRVETGETAAVDASLVELETRQIEIEDLQLAAEKVTLLGELRPLLGLSSNRDLTITGTLSAPAKTTAANAVAGRPDVLAAEARVDAAVALAQQQRASRWEDIGVGATYEGEREKDEPDPTETDHRVGFKINIPLPLWNNNSGRIREADAAAARAAKEVEAARLTAHAEAIAARDEMAAQAKLVTELDAAVLPKAAQIEDQLRGNYAAGQTALTEVLRARSRRLELERLRLDALRDYHLARVRYQSATSTMTPMKGGEGK